MRSIYLTDKTKSADTDWLKDDTEELNAKGFFPVAIVLFLIYVMTSRPALYASVYEWISQLFAIGHIIKM